MEQVFIIWGSSAALARALGEDAATVRAWKRRRRIPANRDIHLVAAARSKGWALSTDHLALLRAGVPGVVIPKLDVVAA